MFMSYKRKLHLKKLARNKRGKKFPKTVIKIRQFWENERKNLPIQSKICLTCKKVFKRTIYRNSIIEPYPRFIKRQYCSLYCSRHSIERKIQFTNWSQGSKNINWKGGRNKSQDGYIIIWQPHHPFANKNKYVMEHRLVMEKKLGRFLKPKEVVHHINEVRHDNRIKNLQLFKNSGYHLNHHLNK